MTKSEVLDLMRSSKTRDEWNDNCDKVKAAVRSGAIKGRSGDYPDYWFGAVIQSGLEDSVLGPVASGISVSRL